MTRSATIGGVRLVYDVAGHPDTPPMMLLHGLGESRTSWAPVMPRLAAGHHVHAVDLRGHGDSGRPGRYGFTAMRDDVVGLLEELSLGAVVLVGHSMGGVVALRVALARPDLVAAMVIEDVVPPYRRTRPVPARPGADPGFDWDAAVAVIGEVNAGDEAMWAALTTIGAPTLVIGGGPASHIPQDLIVRLAALVPTSTLVTISAGHDVHAQCPDEFTEVVMRWAAATGVGQPKPRAR